MAATSVQGGRHSFSSLRVTEVAMQYRLTVLPKKPFVLFSPARFEPMTFRSQIMCSCPQHTVGMTYLWEQPALLSHPTCSCFHTRLDLWQRLPGKVKKDLAKSYNFAFRYIDEVWSIKLIVQGKGTILPTVTIAR